MIKNIIVEITVDDNDNCSNCPLRDSEYSSRCTAFDFKLCKNEKRLAECIEKTVRTKIN